MGHKEESIDTKNDTLKNEEDPFQIFSIVKNDKLKPFVLSKLLSYQILHVHKLLASIANNNFTLDGSDPGIGKTYHALAVCKQLGMNPFIICKMRLISKWLEVCRYFDVKPVAIVNITSEKVITCFLPYLSASGPKTI